MVAGHKGFAAFSPLDNDIGCVHGNTVFIDTIRNGGCRENQFGTGDGDDVFFVKALAAGNAAAVDDHAVGAVVVGDVIAVTVPCDGGMKLGYADMIQRDGTPGITADGDFPVISGSNGLPLVRIRLAGKNEQHTLLYGFHTVINADEVTVADFVTSHGGIVVNQTVGGRFGAEYLPVLHDPRAALADKAAVVTRHDPGGQHNVIFVGVAAEGHDVFSEAVQPHRYRFCGSIEDGDA